MRLGPYHSRPGTLRPYDGARGLSVLFSSRVTMPRSTSTSPMVRLAASSARKPRRMSAPKKMRQCTSCPVSSSTARSSLGYGVLLAFVGTRGSQPCGMGFAAMSFSG